MIETLKTIHAAWPMLKQAVRNGQLFRPQCTLKDADPDVNCEYDVEVPISKGYSLTANVFRSEARTLGGSPDPVVMCAHPYDNHITPALGKTPLGGPPQQYRLIPQGHPNPQFSELTSWESPDPNYWVAAGYTLVNLNLTGYANSGGRASIISKDQGSDYREAIEWVGKQDWCTGKVGLLGVSYLAISQFLAAASPYTGTGPSALRCMVPWEGLTDLYRDVACPGGVTGSGFLNFWWHTEVKGTLNQTIEDFVQMEGAIPPEMIQIRPLMDPYWADRAAALESIETPMLVCGSFSDHELHTRGSHRAFERVSSSKKWLYTHRGGKWSEFYSEQAQSLIRDFMDHFLKDTSNQFDTAKPVRLEVRTSREEVHAVRWENEWPLARTHYRGLYINKDSLQDEPRSTAAEVTYSGAHGSAAFDYTFEQDTEVSGFMNLRLWVEARPGGAGDPHPDDMILCIVADKLDEKGNPVRFNGTIGVSDDVVTRGYLRVSRREKDPELTTSWRVELRGRSELLLRPDEIVPVDVTLQPSATYFRKGERLRLVVASYEPCPSPVFTKDLTLNSGTHVLHFGGDYDACLRIPVIPEQ
ncbi:MAG: CocE/NonD family hydrolase [Verrucomicrobiota bacterium]